MAYVSLYRKHRPQTFDELLGQEAVSRTLAHAVSEDRIAHAYLFTGPRGTGKTSTARILAKALNCELGPTPNPCGKCEPCVAIANGSSLDVIEMDAASHSKVDETREVLAGVPLATAGGRRKVYVIDEVHMLSTPSFNALLKTLEEPPAHVLFILATTEAHKVLPTIISRTQRFDFRRVPAHVLEEHLTDIAKREGINADPDVFGIIARHADGGVRDALSMLDQLGGLGGRVSVEDVERMLGERREDAFLELFDALVAEDVGHVFRTVAGLVGEGADARQLAIGALGHARALLLLKTSPEAEALLEVNPEDVPRLGDQARRFTTASLLRTLDLVSRSLSDMRNVSNHRLLLELALVRAAAPDTDPSANGLLGRIERLERRMGIEEAADRTTAPARPSAAVADGRSEAAPDPGVSTEAGREAPGPSPASAAPKGRAASSVPAASKERAASPVPAASEAPGPEPAAPVRRQDDAPLPPAGTDHVGLSHMRDAWPAVLREVSKRSKRVWGLLNPSQATTYEGGVLAVEVQSAFHQETMGQPHNRDLLADSLHAALGVRPPLVFSARPPAPSAAAPESQLEDATATEAPSEDPIELVKRDLGAEVVEDESSRAKGTGGVASARPQKGTEA
jgi:DNA polymerase-3 subunit gamma/tau